MVGDIAESPTTGELFKAKAITAEDLHAAVDAYMSDPAAGLFAFGEEYGLDLAAAVSSSDPAVLVLKDVHASETHKGATVCTAILLARREKW